MKKKIISIVAVLVVVTATTVLAKTFTTTVMREKLNQGYSETDVYSMLAIISGCEDKSFPEIEAKYKELGNWEDVAEYFGISQKNYEAFYQAQADLKKVTEIPDDVYNEMIASGMSEDECFQFAITAFNGKVDVSEAWEAKKIGKTINDLVRERVAVETQKSQTASDYAYGLMTEEEYIKKMQSFSPDMPMSEIIEFAANERKELRNFMIASSGITEEEIAFAEKCGISNVIDMCRIKNAEKISDKGYAELIQIVKNGETVGSVVKNYISTSKINKIIKSAEEKR